MARIIKDKSSGCPDDYLLVVTPKDDSVAWVKVGNDVIYIRKDVDGTLVVRVMPDDDSDTLYGEVIVNPVGEAL
jgi:hypothetical protein